LITIPFGIDLADYKIVSSDRKTPNKLFHIGAMNWEPNREAMNWFSDEIWPLIQKEDLSFHMAGRSMSAHYEKMTQANFKVHGEVESMHDFMNANDIMIVPLLSGSGMRIKIIEGMAMGKTVISTSLGAEGINCKHNESIIIADTAKEFAAAIKELIAAPEKVNRIGKAARKLVETQYDNATIIAKLLDFYKS
jgi:glycosyltransferase involved in cell wall biosynthesis